MSIITEEQRRIAQTKQALRRLATGEQFKRGELFDKKDGKYEGWVNRLLNRMIELGIVEATGNSFARRYQIPEMASRKDLLAQSRDNKIVAMLLWPAANGPFASPEPEPEPELELELEPEPERVSAFAGIDPNGPTDAEVAQAVLLLLRLMGGVVEKLDRIERTQLECAEILREFQS